MKREEIEKAIENGDSVWLVFEDRIYKLDKSKIIDINDCYVEYYNNYYRCNLYATISDFYETEARAKHFISHCGVTRTETLPFLTWEEFLEKKEIKFMTKNIVIYKLCILTDQVKRKSIGITHIMKNGFMRLDFEYELTEDNFYKAYDECVRLFKEEE